MVNQTYSPSFERMLARLSDFLGRCLVITGTPHSIGTTNLGLKRAPAYDRRKPFHRAKSWSEFSLYAFGQLLISPGRPFILAGTNPPLAPHLAWILHALRGMPYGLLIWDIYPEHIVSMGWLKPGNPFLSTWQAVNRAALLAAEVVITISNRMAETLLARAQSPLFETRLKVIPMWAETNLIKPIPKSQNLFARRHGQADKLTVLYSGNISANHGLEAVVQSAKRLQSDQRISFLIIGNGLGREPLARDIASLGLANISLVDSQGYEMVPLSLATGDIALVMQPPGTEHISMPSKTYWAMAAGSAIIALSEDRSDLATIVRENDAGVVCPWNDAARLSETIARLADHPDDLERLRANARRAAAEKYSAEAVYGQFIAALEPFVKAPGRSFPGS